MHHLIENKIDSKKDQIDSKKDPIDSDDNDQSSILIEPISLRLDSSYSESNIRDFKCMLTNIEGTENKDENKENKDENKENIDENKENKDENEYQQIIKQITKEINQKYFKKFS